MLLRFGFPVVALPVAGFPLTGLPVTSFPLIGFPLAGNPATEDSISGNTRSSYSLFYNKPSPSPAEARMGIFQLKASVLKVRNVRNLRDPGGETFEPEEGGDN